MPLAPIRVAVVGVGHWGPNLARCADQLGRLTWLIDPRPERLDALRARFPAARFSVELEDALADDELDAVLLATPTSTHAALAERCLARGKHVFVEKPLATSVADALRVQDLAQRQGRVLMVGHVFLFNAAVLEIGRRLAANELGALRLITMTRTNLGPVRRDVDEAFDLLSHDLSIADFWLGTGPRTVSATGGSWLQAGVSDAVFATLRYPNDVLVNAAASWLHPKKSREIAVVGATGMITFDDLSTDAPVTIYRRSIGPGSALIDEGLESPQLPPGEPLQAEVRHFFECIASGRAPLTDAARALRVVRTLEALERSLQARGAEVEVAA
jgi:predicted dehydrogenase